MESRWIRRRAANARHRDGRGTADQRQPRIILQQRKADGATVRSVSEARMGKLFTLAAEQNGRRLPVEIRYDKVIWSGLSWAMGEIRHEQIAPGEPIRIQLEAAESDSSLHLDGRVYVVDYR